MNILKPVINSVDNFFDYIAKARTVEALSQLSDRQLADVGFSRDQLNAEVTELWVSNTAEAVEPAKASVVRKPAKAPNFDLGAKLVSMYSSRNPTGHVV